MVKDVKLAFSCRCGVADSASLESSSFWDVLERYPIFILLPFLLPPKDFDQKRPNSSRSTKGSHQLNCGSWASLFVQSYLEEIIRKYKLPVRYTTAETNRDRCRARPRDVTALCVIDLRGMEFPADDFLLIFLSSLAMSCR